MKSIENMKNIILHLKLYAQYVEMLKQNVNVKRREVLQFQLQFQKEVKMLGK